VLHTARTPRILYLFCCQGCGSEGYRRAGFEVTGVDIVEQPNYRKAGFAFHRSDALEFVARRWGWIRRNFHAVHAAPPCQGYSDCQRIMQREHPMLIEPVRGALDGLGLPYVIENVEGARAELRSPVTLCGAMFTGLHTYRHRLFETGNGFTLPQPDEPAHLWPIAKMGRPFGEDEFYHAVGNFSGVDKVRREWGVPWANRDGIREGIPPHYSRWIGTHLYAYLQSSGALA
jgi:DNA (cytosine-5)-methyltransferase 1